MPIPEEYVYILTNYRGYLSTIKQFGPIVQPAKVKKSEAVALMMAGCPIIIYDPVTKKSYPLTFKNANLTTKEVLHEIQKPIEPSVLKGAPKGVGDFGISEVKTEDAKEEVTPTEIIEQVTTNEDTSVHEEVPVEEEVKINVNDLLQNLRDGSIAEKDIKWSDYTKNERRQIRACLNEIASEASTESTENV